MLTGPPGFLDKAMGLELSRFKRSLREAKVIRYGDYDYFANAVTDGVLPVEPTLLEEVIGGFAGASAYRCDLIVAPEAMGIPLAVPLSLRLRIPYIILRKRGYGLPGELRIKHNTGYSDVELFINGVGKGDRVVVVDDVLSTGGTLRSIVQGLRSIGAEVVDVVVAVDKGDKRKNLERELGLSIKALVKVEVREGRVVVLS
ncbi:MAG TPA: hypoxanthine/guanine phosphoribosyltransferase [Methanomassiliicoccales archaeon]|nr:hypoxanthine/guanine phosphoribosyltransferase [Methanomassiliicoccales archaeon]